MTGLLTRAMTGTLDAPTEALAFERAASAVQRKLFAIAFGVLRDPAEAEEALQETFLLAWRNWANLRERSAPDGWFAKICVNHCIRRRASLLKKWRTTTEQDERRAAADSHLTNGGEHADLDRAYKRLSRQQRAVVVLHYYHGYSLVECGDLMNCRPGTVASHLSRALAALRVQLTAEEVEQ